METRGEKMKKDFEKIIIISFVLLLVSLVILIINVFATKRVINEMSGKISSIELQLNDLELIDEN
jgi:cell division protein FtsL